MVEALGFRRLWGYFIVSVEFRAVDFQVFEVSEPQILNPKPCGFAWPTLALKGPL